MTLEKSMYKYPLQQLVSTDRRFQNSVNLLLDLGKADRIKDYIPTRSSSEILRLYLDDVLGSDGRFQEKHHGRATVLIGPYGKGKSHLILLLLEILSGRKTAETAELIEKIRNVNPDAAGAAEKAQQREIRYLPVLVSNTGMELNQALLISLYEALEKAGLSDIAPDSYFTEALKAIAVWKDRYPATYNHYTELLFLDGKDADEVEKKLAGFDPDTMDYFRTIYPKLTAGSVFNPILQLEAIKVYQGIIRTLCESFGYTGIYIVFDEFSKYIEGHGTEHFASDMRVLQEMCELAAASSDGGMLQLTLIAHKSIREYGSSLPAALRKEYEGVEGRLQERLFVINGQNNYELIRSAIRKTELCSSVLSSGGFADTVYGKITGSSYELSCFNSLFRERRDFDEIIACGCFPLTPVAAYLLLNISEKVAQNERTIFTFLSGDEYGSLAKKIQEHRAGEPYYFGADVIYDYFRELFREDMTSALIHNEWLKADYAISKADDGDEVRIIKTLALINMLNNQEDLRADPKYIALAAGISLQDAKTVLDRLTEKQLLLFRSRLQIYAFRNNVGIDLDNEIKNTMAAMTGSISLSQEIAADSELDFVLPRRYNQEKEMTRYFRYFYLTVDEFLQLPSADVLLDDGHFADGCLIGIVLNKSISAKAVAEKCAALNDRRAVIILPQKKFAAEGSLKKAMAIRRLLADQEFLSLHKVIRQELELYLEDILFEINTGLEQDYLPELGKCRVFHAGSQAMEYKDASAFNAFLSSEFETYYSCTPIVNHELLNIRNVTGQYLRARNTIVNALLNGEDCSRYCTGTSPESMVFRSSLYSTGIYDSSVKPEMDKGTKAVLKEIEDFLMQSIGCRQSFSELYGILLGERYGVRQGIIPIYLASRLVALNDMPVLYLHDREVEVSAEIINNLNERPDEYFLYIEQQNGEKEQYLKALEEMFLPGGEAAPLQGRHRRLAHIVAGIQKWYRSLPQYALNCSFLRDEYTKQEMQEISGFRNIFRKAEVNPREILFDRLPGLFGESPDYTVIPEKVQRVRDILGGFLELEQARAAAEARKAFRIKASDSLASGLRDWYSKQSDNAKSYINSSRVSHMMNYLSGLKTNDDAAVAAELSKIVMDVYMEDWDDSSMDIYSKALLETRTEIERMSDKRDNEGGQFRLAFTGSDGSEIERTYDADDSDATSYFLKNAIESAMDDFGESLETNQKVAVLVQTIEKLLKNK